MKDGVDQFIDAMQQQCKAGISFVPLVGAGLSAPSGNPILIELEVYLVRCICRALGIDHPQAWNPHTRAGEFDLRQFYRWLPGRDDWPPYGDPQIYSRDTENWKQRLSQFFVEASEVAERGSKKAPDELKIIQEAVGASAEWRSSLLFLSRLVAFIPPKGNDGEKDLMQLRFGPPNRDIVDTFVLTVMMGRPPTLGHRMLAALASPLRISLALTTNFDDLLERAFAESNNPCTIFDVHIDSGLPSYRDIAGFNSIVKLHGGRYGMRADYSLDTLPTEADLRHFVSYLAGRPIDEETWREVRQRKNGGPGLPDQEAVHETLSEPLPKDSKSEHLHQKSLQAQRHLLVIGIGAKDARINEMIRAAAIVLPDMKVFWICYLRKEVECARELLEELGIRRESQQVIYNRFPGLLLLHAYQEITGALPATHAVFPSAPRVPVPPIWNHGSESVDNRSQDSAQQDRLCEDLEKCVLMEPVPGADGQLSLPNTRCIVVHGPPEGTGGMSLGAKAFEEQLERGRQAIWIDLDELGSVDDLFESIIHTAARKAGIADWMPVLLRTHYNNSNTLLGKAPTDSQVHELARITNSPNRKWVIFINARSGTGANHDAGAGLANGWLDQVELKLSGEHKDEDRSATGLNVVELVRRIAGEECPNVSVVLLCFDGPFTKLCLPRLKPFPFRFRLSGSTEQRPEEIVESAMEWVSEDKDNTEGRAQFLWALCLANRARFLSMLWQWPFHETVEKFLDDRRLKTKVFLSELEKRRVVRRKSGGFVWMLSRARNLLRVRLFTLLASVMPQARLTAADIHHGLAEAYHRIFRATEDPGAIFEIVYHRCFQARELLDAVASSEMGPTIELSDLSMVVLSALGDASRTLSRGRNCMLSLGFSKSLCRRLHSLRVVHLHNLSDLIAKIDSKASQANAIGFKELCADVRQAIERLQDQSYDLNRAIAVEVGENRIAFRRQTQLRYEQYRRFTANKDGRIEAKMKDGSLDCDTLLRESFDIIKDRTRAEEPVADRPESILRQQKDETKEAWMESMIHFATLGIAARSYEFTRVCLELVFEAVEIPKEFYTTIGSINKQETFVRQWLNDKFPEKESRRAQLRQMIVALRRYQQLVLAEDMAYVTWAERKGRNQADWSELDAAKRHYVSALRCYEIAIRIFRWLGANHDYQRESENGFGEVDFGLDRIWHRLFIHHAMTLAYRQDTTQAHARLNDADALMNVSGFGPQTLERGITELIRAEVLTQQVLYDYREKEPEAAGYNAFGMFRRNILQSISNDELARDGMAGLLNKLDVVLTSENRGNSTTIGEHPALRNSQSCLNDAWQACRRAEQSIKKFRKNVWWTTWFFELQLKLAELDTFAALMAFIADDISQPPRLPLPHLGPESAAYAVPTLIERLLDNAERMVRVDLFRLGRIVESFANTVFVGLLWTRRLNRGRSRDFMTARIKLLCRRIREAEDRLRLALLNRESEDAQLGYAKVDENVVHYVKFVLDHCSRVSQCVSVAQEELL